MMVSRPMPFPLKEGKKGRLSLKYMPRKRCQVSGNRTCAVLCPTEQRGSGEGLPTQIRPIDGTCRQTTADALQGLRQDKRQQDGAGNPSAWDSPGYLA